ncbi:MAG: CPBP family intramembrane metalloprotease [Verrucomicrobia bacterium]|nr:CPBP family intramembrane metalloprotease [Verrucomicrobiota bacterium]
MRGFSEKRVFGTPPVRQSGAMNRGWKGITGFLGLWVLLTALLFPVVRWGVEATFPGMFTSPRIFGRVQLGVALGLGMGLLWFWRDVPKRFFEGRKWPAIVWRVVMWGILGTAMVALAAWIQSILGVRKWAGVPGFDLWAGALATGFLVAVLEEFFFRGILGLAFWKAAGQRPVPVLLGFNALVFAVAHFLRPQSDLPHGIFSGFVAWTKLELWAGPADVWRLAGLFVSGLILARLSWQQQSLWAAIGIHAGWITGLRIGHGFWCEASGVSGGWWGPSLESGPIPLVLLLLVAFSLWGRPARARLD